VQDRQAANMILAGEVTCAQPMGRFELMMYACYCCHCRLSRALLG
jgi:hypothetical protein